MALAAAHAFAPSLAKVFGDKKNTGDIRTQERSHMEPEVETTARVDKLIKNGHNVFKFDGSPDAAIVKKFRTWFVKLISDEDVLKSTKVDTKVLVNIVLQTGPTVDRFAILIKKRERREEPSLILGSFISQIRIVPTSRLLYRIQLHTWSQSKRIVMVQDNSNGITVGYFGQILKPQKRVMDGLKSETQALAIKQAEDILG